MPRSARRILSNNLSLNHIYNPLRAVHIRTVFLCIAVGHNTCNKCSRRYLNATTPPWPIALFGGSMPRLKRFFGVSCSHAQLVDRSAWNAMLKAKKDFDPHFTFHLGDFVDTTGWRSGAAGADLADDYRGDISTGLTHLEQLQPQLVLCGNHEQRLWREMGNKDGRIAGLAGDLITHIEKFTSRELGAELVEYDGVWQGRYLGDYVLTHGTIYNQQACRDMAEMYGNVIFGHTHTAGIQQARNIHRSQGINIGTLTDRREMKYADSRRQTMAWRQAWVYGEYHADRAYPQLHIHAEEPISFPKASKA